MKSGMQLTGGAAAVVLGLRVAAIEAAARGETPGHGAWLRYGADPVRPDEVELAASRYRVAVLQPWDLPALHALKARKPDMVVLCYKCFSSTRSSAPVGVVSAAGVAFAEAEEMGERWFAHRESTGQRVEWRGFPEHWQMAVWAEDYRARWIANVVSEVAGEPWDGVFADNDVFDDYYGLGALAEIRDMADMRAALELLVEGAGTALNDVGKLLVPNIAESRRDPGRWARHARYGGGFEEHWLGWRPDRHFDAHTCEQQGVELHGPGIGVVRINICAERDHRGFLYGVAAFWVLGGGQGWACTATVPDQYNGVPYIREQSWDLGRPSGPVLARDDGRAREFTGGWAAVNLSADVPVTFAVPMGLQSGSGEPAPSAVTLAPKEGCIYASAETLQRARTSHTPVALLALDTRPRTGEPQWFELTGEARVENGRLRLPLRPRYADSATSRTTFSASGWAARARVDRPAMGPSAETLLMLRADDGDLVAIGKSGDTLLLRFHVGGHRTDQTETFDSSDHRWWSLSIDDDGIRWATSEDGLAWWVHRELTDSRLSQRQVRVSLTGGRFEMTGDDEDALFDVLEVVRSPYANAQRTFPYEALRGTRMPAIGADSIDASR